MHAVAARQSMSFLKRHDEHTSQPRLKDEALNIAHTVSRVRHYHEKEMEDLFDRVRLQLGGRSDRRDPKPERLAALGLSPTTSQRPTSEAAEDRQGQSAA